MDVLSQKRGKLIAYIAAALLVVVVLMFIVVGRASYTIRVTELQAQTLLDAQLVKLRAKNPVYEIDHVTLHFVGDHMTVEAAGGYTKKIAAFPAVDVTARLSSSGKLDYSVGSIYFLASAFSLDSFLLDGEEPSAFAKRLVSLVATEKLPKLRDAALAHPKVSKWLDKLGVSVNATKNDLAIAAGGEAVNAIVEQYREPANNLIEERVRHVLETTPLYTLGKNWKEKLVLATLPNISIKDGVLAVTLTGWQLLSTLFFLAFGVISILGLGFGIYFSVRSHQRFRV